MKILYLLLIIFSFLSCSNNIELLPNNICKLTISQKLTGAKASSYVNNLHFNDVTQEGNEVGFYSGKNKAVIYITYYSFELDAQQNFSKMINKISPLNSPFSNISSIEVEGKIIYKTFGLGQVHFVFVNKINLFWLSVDESISDCFLIEYLKFLK